jgi:hypothetical protein
MFANVDQNGGIMEAAREATQFRRASATLKRRLERFDSGPFKELTLMLTHEVPARRVATAPWHFAFLAVAQAGGGRVVVATPQRGGGVRGGTPKDDAPVQVGDRVKVDEPGNTFTGVVTGITVQRITGIRPWYSVRSDATGQIAQWTYAARYVTLLARGTGRGDPVAAEKADDEAWKKVAAVRAPEARARAPQQMGEALYAAAAKCPSLAVLFDGATDPGHHINTFEAAKTMEALGWPRECVVCFDVQSSNDFSIAHGAIIDGRTDGDFGEGKHVKTKTFVFWNGHGNEEILGVSVKGMATTRPTREAVDKRQWIEFLKNLRDSSGSHGQVVAVIKVSEWWDVLVLSGINLLHVHA